MKFLAKVLEVFRAAYADTPVLPVPEVESDAPAARELPDVQARPIATPCKRSHRGPLLHLTEAARYIGFTPRRLVAYVQSGHVRPVWKGRALHFHTEDLEVMRCKTCGGLVPLPASVEQQPELG